MQLYGLVGRNISYSFSRDYFTDKFAKLQIDARYGNFDMADLSDLPRVLSERGLRGFNVTIPYKEEIIPHLDRLSPEARIIGAVNTVKIEDDRSLSGHNTDWLGFLESVRPMLTPSHKSALVLGTGGASKAVVYALRQLGIQPVTVSRRGEFTYSDICREKIDKPVIVVNCTPLGTFPNIGECPPLPGEFLESGDIAYDLIYNPSKTRFLALAESRGAATQNGLRMLQIQADKAFEIWTRD